MKSIEERLSEAEVLFNRGQTEEARDLLNELYREAPEHPEVLNNLGVLAGMDNQHLKALEYLGKAIERNPSYKEAALNFTDVLRRMGQLGQAVRMLEIVSGNCPGDADLAAALDEARLDQAADSKSEEPNSERASEDFVHSNPMKKTPWNFGPEVFDSSPEVRIKALADEANRQLAAGREDLFEQSLLKLAAMSHYGNPSVVNSLLEIYRKRDDIPAIQQLWKRVAVSYLELGNWHEFLHLSYRAIHSELFYGQNPSYKFSKVDWDLSAAIHLAASGYPLYDFVRQHRKELKRPGLGEKLRLGFVMEGFSYQNAPTRTLLPIIENHDRERFECFAYSRIGMDTDVAQKQDYAKTVDIMRKAGVAVRAPESQLSPTKEVDFILHAMAEDELDIAFYRTLYFVPAYNLISALRPAPFQAVSYMQQPEYIRNVDLTFVPAIFAMECATPIARFPKILTSEIPDGMVNRKDVGLSDDAIVLISANREVKYRQPQFWKALESILGKHPQAYFIGLGMDNVDDTNIDDPDILSRIIAPGFKDNVMEWMKMADIYVDVFPMGGGTPALEAMPLGLPVVCFGENFDNVFSFTEMVAMGAVLEIPETTAPPGDVAAWCAIVESLIVDPAKRAAVGEKMQKRAEAFEVDTVSRSFYDNLFEAFVSKIKAEEKS